MAFPTRNYEEWEEIGAPAANADAVATKAAKPGQRHFVTSIEFSQSGGTPTAIEATLTSGATNKGRWRFAAAVWFPIQFLFYGVRCGINEAVVATLPAMGATITGRVVLRGYTKGE